MKKTLIYLLAMCTVIGAQAQNSNRKRTCPADHIVADKIAIDANYKAKHEEIEKHTQQWVKNHTQPITNARMNTVPQVTIPVVVHILYNNAAQNISDAQVISQIDALNKDFRRLNADAVNTPAIFQSVAADCEIEFCLAKQDPMGNPTTGITRTNTFVSQFNYNGANPNYSNAYFTNQGGHDAWNTNNYLNIWVCNFDIHGLGTYPTSAGTSTDGIIVRYSSFGTIGALEPEWMEGGITTHEVGHYLNLKHIFNDNPNIYVCYSLLGGDGIDDTPSQQYETNGCPNDLSKNTCNAGYPGDLPDMYMNYMDYSDDPCINMFTLGQKARMLAVFAPGGARESLKTSPGCTPVPCNAPSNIIYTHAYMGVFEKSAVTVSWTGNNSYTYHIKIYRKNTLNNTWIFQEEAFPATSTANFNAYWDTPYKVEVYSKCGDGSTSIAAIKSDIFVAEPTETNDTYATAELISNLTDPNSLINGVTKEASVCMLGCATPDTDIFTFTTFYTNYRNVVVTIPSGQITSASGDLYLYRQECVVLSNGRLSCETDEPTLVAACTTSATNSITYRPCYSKQYKYYVVVKKDPAYAGSASNIYASFLPYKLNVRLMADYTPVCLPGGGFSRMSNGSNPDELLIEKEVISVLSVFPNPSTGKYTVELLPMEGEIAITNTLGQLVHTLHTDENTTQYEFDISTQPSGIYFMEMKQEGQVIYRTKIVKE